MHRPKYEQLGFQTDPNRVTADILAERAANLVISGLGALAVLALVMFACATSSPTFQTKLTDFPQFAMEGSR